MLNPGARNAGPGCALRVMTVSGYWRPLSSNGLGTASPSVGSGGAGTATGRMRDSDDVLSPERVRVLRAERVQRRQRLGNVLAWRRVVTASSSSARTRLLAIFAMASVMVIAGYSWARNSAKSTRKFS